MNHKAIQIYNNNFTPYVEFKTKQGPTIRFAMTYFSRQMVPQHSSMTRRASPESKATKKPTIEQVIANLNNLVSYAPPYTLINYYLALLSSINKKERGQWKKCPNHLLLLAKSYKFTCNLFKKKFTDFQLTLYIFSKVSWPDMPNSPSSLDCKLLFDELLRHEMTDARLVEVDPGFLKLLFKKLTKKMQNELLSLTPFSPIQILLAHGSSDPPNDFYRFCNLKELESKAAFADASGLNHKFVYDVILNTEFPQIKELAAFFAEMFPEYLTYDRAVSPKRTEYFRNMYCLPLKSSYLRTYLCLLARDRNLKEDEQIDLHFLYIERILQEKDGKLRRKLLKSVVNDWFVDIPGLTDKFMAKRPTIISCNELVRLMPCSSKWFRLVLDLVKSTRCSWYCDLLFAIVIGFPTRKHFRMLQHSILYFDVPIPDNIKRILECSL